MLLRGPPGKMVYKGEVKTRFKGCPSCNRVVEQIAIDLWGNVSIVNASRVLFWLILTGKLLLEVQFAQQWH